MKTTDQCLLEAHGETDFDYYKVKKAMVAYAEQFKPVWRSVKIELPNLINEEKSDRVLILTFDDEIGIGHRYIQHGSEKSFWAWDNTMPVKNVTHWMPLPE